jgi:hypothetical protein
MKKIIILFFALFTDASTKAQLISPNESTEFCPLVNTTFIVTIPLIKSGSTITLSTIGTSNIINGVTGLSSAGNTTFSFVGRFSDDNVTQSFRVDFTKSDNNNDFKIFEFKKIKSLKIFSLPSAINTNISNITVSLNQLYMLNNLASNFGATTVQFD